MKKCRLLSYVLITYLITWTFWIINFTVPTLHDSFRIIGSFVPIITALFFIYHYEGKEKLKKCFKKLVAIKASPLIYLFVFSYSIIIIYVPLFICNSLGCNYSINIASDVFGYSTNSVIQIFLCLLLISIAGGPLGEELGWRGLVLPKFQKRFNPFISAIVVAGIWSLWHLPMFYFHAEGYENFLQFLFGTICLSLIVTWLYNKTKGSLFIEILFHAIDDYVNYSHLHDLMNILNTSYFYRITYYAVLLIILLLISIDMIRKPLKYEM